MDMLQHLKCIMAFIAFCSPKPSPSGATQPFCPRTVPLQATKTSLVSSNFSADDGLGALNLVMGVLAVAGVRSIYVPNSYIPK